MLLGLHVKNLALIEKAEVEFTGGLNILTGETGAGKSILIGSVGLALGGKASKDMIRQGEDSALVELAFSVDDEKKKNALEALDIAPDEDGLLIISKKLFDCEAYCKSKIRVHVKRPFFSFHALQISSLYLLPIFRQKVE